MDKQALRTAVLRMSLGTVARPPIDPKFLPDAENKVYQRLWRSLFQFRLELGTIAHQVTVKVLNKPLDRMRITKDGIDGPVTVLLAVTVKRGATIKLEDLLREIGVEYRLPVHGSEDPLIVLKLIGKPDVLTDTDVEAA